MDTQRPTMHTGGMHIGTWPQIPISLLADTKFASESNHSSPALNANHDFPRNFAAAPASELAVYSIRVVSPSFPARSRDNTGTLRGNEIF